MKHIQDTILSAFRLFLGEVTDRQYWHGIEPLVYAFTVLEDYWKCKIIHTRS